MFALYLPTDSSSTSKTREKVINRLLSGSEVEFKLNLTELSYDIRVETQE